MAPEMYLPVSQPSKLHLILLMESSLVDIAQLEDIRINLLIDGPSGRSRDKLPGMKTEPIGRIPWPFALIKVIAAYQSGEISREALDEAYANALRDTIGRFEQTDSPVITDGEQTKPSFATYPLSGLGNLTPDEVIISFADGHVRQVPHLTACPFRSPEKIARSPLVKAHAFEVEE